MALPQFLAKLFGTFAIFGEINLYFRDFKRSFMALSRFLANFLGTFAICSELPWHFRDF